MASGRPVACADAALGLAARGLRIRYRGGYPADHRTDFGSDDHHTRAALHPAPCLLVDDHRFYQYHHYYCVERTFEHDHDDCHDYDDCPCAA